MHWETLFGFTVPPLELVVRGSCVFWFLFAVFRLVLRRGVGAIGIADILVVVLIGTHRKTRWGANTVRSPTVWC